MCASFSFERGDDVNKTRFLLARFHLEYLIGQESVRTMRDALKRLLTGSDAYDCAYIVAMKINEVPSTK